MTSNQQPAPTPAPHMEPGVPPLLDQQTARPPAVSAVFAWEILLAGGADDGFVADHMELLSSSICDPILDSNESPLRFLARTGVGQQMRLGAKVFESAVGQKTMSAFREGALGTMALVAGNPLGAFEAAKATPEIHQNMRDSNHVTLMVQCMISENYDLLRKLTARVNDKPLLDPHHTSSSGFGVLSTYFKRSPSLSIDAVKVFADCLLQSKNLSDVSAAYYQRYFSLLDRYGKTCMHSLAQRMSDPKISDTRFAEIFSWIGSQVDINHPDSDDEPVLITASRYNRPIVSRTLLEEGAILNWVTHKGRTALGVAAYHGHNDLISLYMQYDSEQANVDPGLRKSDGDAERLRIPLIAAKNKHWPALKEYLVHSTDGINQHEPTEDRHTPLILAVKELESSTVSRLINSGVEINAVNNHGWTAVHYAAHHFSGKSLRERNDPATRILFDLITHGGRLEQADKNGITPLEVISQRTELESSELFFAVNISLLADWVFDGDRSLAEQYIDETNNLSFATQAVLSNIHPVVTKAQKWRLDNQGKVDQAKDVKVRQAKTDLISILVDCFNYSIATFGLITLEPFPPVKRLYDSIPPEWQWPAVGAVGVVMGLARATDFRGDMERFQNIGYAASAMGRKIRKKVLSPALKLLQSCASSDRGPLRHVVRYFSAMRKACLKVAMASKAFVHILHREDLANAAPSEVANTLDPEMMKALGDMSYQDFQKFKAQARLNSRRAITEQFDNAAP